MPPREFPIACIYSQLMYGFAPSVFRYASISSDFAYIRLSMSLIKS